MECRDVLIHLWEYLDQELAPEEAQAVADHLRGCGSCYPSYCCDRAFLDLLGRLKFRSQAPTHLLISIRAQLKAF
jgi:mycothiol system anti-sigma-R factor